jgi:CelD/BcsL family acetyltransferase involved in cellulose biosynthesis
VIAAKGSRAPTSPAKVDLVDALDSLRDDWARLAATSGNVFATWEWNRLWWRHYGRGRALRIGVAQRNAEVEAIVPLFMWSRRPLRVLRLMGHGHGDCLGPICDREDDKTAKRVLRRVLETQAHDVFIGDWVASDRNWSRVLRGRIVRRTGYPILRLPESSWDAFLAGQSQRFRKRARNLRNRIEREHAVSYRYADAASLERDLDVAFRLHQARFGAHSGCNFCGNHEQFHRKFAATALERGWLRLLMMELDGAPACFEYGFLFESAYFAYQAGRDPEWDWYSVGFVLELECIRRALEDGATEYRFLGGEEDYKYRFPTEDPRLETVVAPGSRWGRLAAAGVDALWRLPGGRAALRRIGSARAAL